MKKCVVIGSGFGGLAIACRLQNSGYQVTLLEKNNRVGGHASPLHKQGYSWDMGPSLITAPEIIERVFHKAGKKLADYVDLVPLDPFYRIYFHDKSYFDYSPDSVRMKEQMARFNPRDARHYDAFMKASQGIHESVIVQGLGSTPFMDWRTMLAFVPRAIKLKAILPCYTFVKHYFKDFRHRFMFSFHPLFIGGNPFAAPSIYLMIPYLEKVGGVHYTKGGMYSLVRAFEKLFIESGGEIRTEEPAQEIVVAHGRATGVRTGKAFYPADVVVSDADMIHTYRDLLKPEHRRKWSDKKLKRLDYSMSALLIYLGIKRQYPQLLHHTLILSHRYKQLIMDIFKRKILPDDFSLYLHAPTRSDASMAPPGCESLYVLIPVANLQSGIDWSKQAEPYSRKVLHFLEHE
ncbi:MAG: phytoene desaturase family protein, partial [Verrucomicrobia bacterium]|nr:phytoene desaturase family protein [Verrucomicrobiota bacterium]